MACKARTTRLPLLGRLSHGGPISLSCPGVAVTPILETEPSIGSAYRELSPDTRNIYLQWVSVTLGAAKVQGRSIITSDDTFNQSPRPLARFRIASNVNFMRGLSLLSPTMPISFTSAGSFLIYPILLMAPRRLTAGRLLHTGPIGYFTWSRCIIPY